MLLNRRTAQFASCTFTFSCSHVVMESVVCILSATRRNCCSPAGASQRQAVQSVQLPQLSHSLANMLLCSQTSKQLISSLCSISSPFHCTHLRHPLRSNQVDQTKVPPLRLLLVPLPSGYQAAACSPLCPLLHPHNWPAHNSRAESDQPQRAHQHPGVPDFVGQAATQPGDGDAAGGVKTGKSEDPSSSAMRDGSRRLRGRSSSRHSLHWSDSHESLVWSSQEDLAQLAPDRASADGVEQPPGEGFTSETKQCCNPMYLALPLLYLVCTDTHTERSVCSAALQALQGNQISSCSPVLCLRAHGREYAVPACIVIKLMLSLAFVCSIEADTVLQPERFAKELMPYDRC